MKWNGAFSDPRKQNENKNPNKSIDRYENDMEKLK